MTGPGLAVKMTADTVGLSRGINRTERLLGSLAKSTKNATTALRGLVAIELAKVFARATSAISGYISSVREAAGAVARLARLSNTSTRDFQRFAIGAKTVGIENDKLADIFKDVNDRVGDFLQTGGGPMADFFENIAPKVGVTAEQFAALSGPDALQLYVDSLQKANLTAAEMTFYLEAMASDASVLIPLLQNGAKGFDEIADRAERLGIILSEEQTSAITDMNRSLLLVSQTIEGIIGQVTANLAPIVTAISEEFLAFVEAFQGFAGEGGSGIANALTEGLLDFAEYMAKILDGAIESFQAFGAQMIGVSQIFESVANTFVAVSETLRSLWNVLETIVDGLRVILGWFIEKLASLFSGGLFEAVGRQIREDAMAAAEKNAAQAAEAAVNAANAALGDRNFGENVAQSTGLLSGIVAGARKRFEQGRAASAMTDAEREQERLRKQREQAELRARLDADKLAKAQQEAESKRIEAITKLNEDYAKESQALEKERLEKLSENTRKALEVSDIRSGGISQVLALATGREDPAIAEARKQVRKLDEIRLELRNLGVTVDLLGAA